MLMHLLSKLREYSTAKENSLVLQYHVPHLEALPSRWIRKHLVDLIVPYGFDMLCISNYCSSTSLSLKCGI